MVRYVRTPAGADHYGEPIGSPIIAGGAVGGASEVVARPAAAPAPRKALVAAAWTADTEVRAREMIRELVDPDANTPDWLIDEDEDWEPTPADQIDALVEARISETRDKVRSLLADAHVMVQVDARVLPGILRSGGFKTADDPDAVSRGIAARNAEQYDGNAKAALEAALAARRELQTNLFGDPASPVYGYLAAGPKGAQDDESRHPMGTIQAMIPLAYGDTALRLRRDRVEHRTTVTFGDSFAMTSGGGDPYLAPTPLAAPDWQAAGAMDLAEVTSVDDAGMTTHASYVEHQIHGGVALEDVEAVVFDRDPPRQLADALRAAGLGVEVLGSIDENVDLPEGGFDEGTFDLDELGSLAALDGKSLPGMEWVGV